MKNEIDTWHPGAFKTSPIIWRQSIHQVLKKVEVQKEETSKLSWNNNLFYMDLD